MRVSKKFAIAASMALLLGPTAVTTVTSTGVASAHAYVATSDPADKAVLDAGPASVQVTFSETVTNPTLTVTGPDGNAYAAGDTQANGRTVSVNLNPLGPSGVYKTHYTVTSDDGHVIEGDRSFTVNSGS